MGLLNYTNYKKKNIEILMTFSASVIITTCRNMASRYIHI